MIMGVPIDNGDGSYTFQTDLGEPLTLRGDAAQQAFDSYSAAPESAAPTMPAQDLVDTSDPRTAGLDKKQVSDLLTVPGQAPRVASPSIADVTGGSLDEAARIGAATDVGAQTGQAGLANMWAQASAPTPASSAALAKLGQQTEANMTAAERAARGKPSGAGGAVFMQRPAAAPRPAVGGGPARPSGPVPIQQTVQGTMPLSDEDEMASKRAGQEQYLAAEKVTEAAAKTAREQAELRATGIEEDRRAMVDMEAREAERQRIVGEKLAKIDRLANEAASGKIDPDHYWKDGDAAIKFAQAPFIALSVYASGMGGGPPYALQQMNADIERDMRAQEANLANKKEALHAQTNLLGQLRQEFGDRDAAAAAFRAAKTGQMQRQVDEIAGRNLSNEQKAKLAEFAAALNKQNVAEKQAAGRITYNRTERLGGVGGGAVGGMTAKELLADAKDYGKDIQGAKLNESEASVANVEEALSKYKGKDEIPGVGTENVFTRAVKGAADYVVGQGTGEKIYYNKEERANRQSVHFLKADLKHAITGAGMSDTERADLDQMIEGAKGYSDLANVTKIIKTRIAKHKASLAGGHTPEAVELYELRKKAARTKDVAQGRGINIRPAGEE